MSWSISNYNDLEDIASFLEQEEWKCIQPLSDIISGNRYKFPNPGDVLILKNLFQKRIVSLIFITSRGLIYPVFRSSIYYNQDNKEDLIKIMAKIKFTTHGVVGLSEDVNYFNSLISKRIRGINNYKILCRDSDEKLPEDSNLYIYKADMTDLKKLAELEYEYQIEEVLLKPGDLNRRAIYENFKKKLKKDDIYYLNDPLRALPLSKGGTTFKSLNYTLIGGVYTRKEMRNNGFSRHLLSYLINDQLNKGYRSALFVKDSNRPALHLYKKLGFNDAHSYQINYYYN